VIPVQEEPRVIVLWHRRRRRADAPVRLRLENERRVLPRGRSLEHDHRAILADLDALHLDARRWLESPEHRRDVTERDVRDLLTDELAVGRHANQHVAALAVEKCAERLARAP